MTTPAAQPTILIIDDEPDLRELIRDVLADQGCRVFCAANGPDGIVLNEQENPDVILLDLRMPGMDGITTLRNIRRSDDRVQVVILTGFASPDTIRDAAELQVSEYLSKPFANSDLVSVITTAYESSLAERQE